MTTAEKALREAELIYPKLSAFRNRVGGGLLHETLQHIAVVQGYRDMLKHSPSSDLANDLSRVCQEAQRFLAQAAKGF